VKTKSDGIHHSIDSAPIKKSRSMSRASSRTESRGKTEEEEQEEEEVEGRGGWGGWLRGGLVLMMMVMA
jgi:hypothetical protein